LYLTDCHETKLLFCTYLKCCVCPNKISIVLSYGCEIFVQDGFMYIFEEFNFNRTKWFWICCNKDMCKPRVHTEINDDENIKKNK